MDILFKADTGVYWVHDEIQMRISIPLWETSKELNASLAGKASHASEASGEPQSGEPPPESTHITHRRHTTSRDIINQTIRYFYSLIGFH